MLKLNEIFVIKRDGRKLLFDIKLIQQAIFKAAYRGKIDEKFIGSYHVDPFKSNGLANRVTEHVVIDIQNLNRDTVEIDDIQNIYIPMGFSNFKIEGRGLGSALVLEFLLYYMTKPEYQLHVREAIYLDNMLDLL